VRLRPTEPRCRKRTAVDVEIGGKPYRRIVENAAGIAQISRAESRSLRGMPDTAEFTEVLDAEIVPDPDSEGDVAQAGTETRPGRPIGLRSGAARGSPGGRFSLGHP
jgi:hypothetical protein